MANCIAIDGKCQSVLSIKHVLFSLETVLSYLYMTFVWLYVALASSKHVHMDV